MSDKVTGWTLDVKPEVIDYLRGLGLEVQNEVGFKMFETAKEFAQYPKNTHYCTNILYPVEKYTGNDGKLYMKFHVDSQEQKIRLMNFELNKSN